MYIDYQSFDRGVCVYDNLKTIAHICFLLISKSRTSSHFEVTGQGHCGGFKVTR